MNGIFVLILRIIVIRTIGVYIRFFFYKIIGKNVKLEYLKGEKMHRIEQDKQGVYNALVGFPVFALLFFLITYALFKLNML